MKFVDQLLLRQMIPRIHATTTQVLHDGVRKLELHFGGPGGGLQPTVHRLQRERRIVHFHGPRTSRQRRSPSPESSSGVSAPVETDSVQAVIRPRCRDAPALRPHPFGRCATLPEAGSMHVRGSRWVGREPGPGASRATGRRLHGSQDPAYDCNRITARHFPHSGGGPPAGLSGKGVLLRHAAARAVNRSICVLVAPNPIACLGHPANRNMEDVPGPKLRRAGFLPSS